jgi:predicted DNA-binding transcriptional regulator YafY
VTKKIQKEFSDRKVTVYKVANNQKDISEIFRFFLHHSDDIGWLLQIVYENNPTLLKDYEKENKKALQKILKEDEDIFLFVTLPFEKMDDKTFANHFKTLKTAVKNHEYKNITYNYLQKETLQNVKCLKIIYTDNNWYIAVETKDEKLRLLRIAFIEDINYSNKMYYQKKVLEKYTHFFKHIQNAMSLNKPTKTAVLLASKDIAVYFKEGMKKFFPSQKFIKTFEDGTVKFSIDYTNDMEILPFIKKWLPDIKILEPKELQEVYILSLKKMLSSQKN